MGYSLFHEKCSLIESKFGGFRKLRLTRLDMTPLMRRGGRVLDFGSGKPKEKPQWCNEYFTLDNDQDIETTFSSLEEIKKIGIKFDSIIANQVFEHISKNEINGVVADLSSLLVSGGNILVTIPNVCNWVKYISDYDHRNPLTFYHVGALYELNGIECIACYRYTKRFREIVDASETDQYLFEFMKKYFEFDPAQFIAVLGQKL